METFGATHGHQKHLHSCSGLVLFQRSGFRCFRRKNGRSSARPESTNSPASPVTGGRRTRIPGGQGAQLPAKINSFQPQYSAGQPDATLKRCAMPVGQGQWQGQGQDGWQAECGNVAGTWVVSSLVLPRFSGWR